MPRQETLELIDDFPGGERVVDIAQTQRVGRQDVVPITDGGVEAPMASGDAKLRAETSLAIYRNKVLGRVGSLMVMETGTAEVIQAKEQ